MAEILSNTVNELIWPQHYKFDQAQAIVYDYLSQSIVLPSVNSQTLERLVNARKRQQQTPELLQRLKDALIPCQYDKWLKARKITETREIYSIDYEKLSRQDKL